MTFKDKARTKASNIVEIGRRTVMCFTSDRFQANRITKVVMRMVRMKMRNSMSISDLFSDLTTLSTTCIYLVSIFFSTYIINERTSSEWF